MQSGFQQALASSGIPMPQLSLGCGAWVSCGVGGGVVGFMLSQACFSLHFQIGRSALVASSSSLPSFPSTLSWSRDESARRVKYTGMSALQEGQGSLALCLGDGPCAPAPANCPLSCMKQLGSWFLTAAGTCSHAHLTCRELASLCASHCATPGCLSSPI